MEAILAPMGRTTTTCGCVASGLNRAVLRTAVQMPGLINETLTDMQETLGRIKGMVEGLEPDLVSTVANLDRMTTDLALVSERLDSWVSTNDEDMNSFMGDGLGQVPALVSDARRALRELEKLLIDLREDPSKVIYKPDEAAVTVEQKP